MNGLTAKKDIKIYPYKRKGIDTGKWIVDVPAEISETLKRQRLFVSSRKEANELRLKVLRQARHDYLRAHNCAHDVTFDELVNLWHQREVERIKRKTKQKESLEKDLIYLKSVHPFFADYSAAEIETDIIGEYQSARLDAGKKPTTINSEVRTLKAILSFARAKGFINNVPQAEKLPEPKKHYDLPTIEEVCRIVAELPRKQAVLIRLMAETGMRVSEAVCLRWEEIRFDERCILLYDSAYRTMKTRDSARTVYVGAEMIADLDSLPRESEWVFPTRDLRGHTKNVQKALTSAVKRSGVTRNGEPMKLTVKLFRKFFVTILADNRVNIFAIRRMMGHSPNSRITESNYYHMPKKTARGAVLDLGISIRNGATTNQSRPLPRWPASAQPRPPGLADPTATDHLWSSHDRRSLRSSDRVRRARGEAQLGRGKPPGRSC